MDRKMMIGMGVAAVAVAAVGGAAAAAYVLLNEDGGVGTNKQHVSSRPMSINVRIRKEEAGVVIGKRGDTVREIQRRTNTRIHFKGTYAIFLGHPYMSMVRADRGG